MAYEFVIIIETVIQNKNLNGFFCENHPLKNETMILDGAETILTKESDSLEKASSSVRYIEEVLALME